MSADANGSPRRSPWPFVVLAVGVLAAATVLLVVLIGTRETSRAIRSVGEQAADIAERFHTAQITTTFLAAIPETESTGLGNLELATSEVTETFIRAEERKILWDRVSLGETVVEIRVPVTYRYHVRLADAWRLEVEDHTCIVHAPPIRPSLPPAIHTDRMEKRVETDGWFAVDGVEQLEELERDLSPLLEDYARDERHLTLVREAGRKTLANFVRAWLIREDHWGDGRFRTIAVRFPDEPWDRSSFPTLAVEE